MSNINPNMGHTKPSKQGEQNMQISKNKTCRFKMNRKSYLVISIALVVIIISALVFIFARKNMDAKDLYFRIETKNFVNYMNDVIKKQNEYISKMKPLKEQPSRTRHEISVKLTKSDNINEYFNIPKQAIEVVNSSKLVLNSRYDIKKDIHTGSLSFLLEGQSFIDINTFLEGDAFGLQVPVIYDKYFVCDKNNLEEAFDKFNFNIPIKTLFTPNAIKQATKFSLEEIKTILTDYISFIKDLISEQNISITKQTGKNVFTIKLDESEVKEFTKKTIDIICNDQRLFDVTIGKIGSLLQMLEVNGYFNLSDDFNIVYDQIREYSSINTIRDNLLRAAECMIFPDGFSMILTTDKNNNILDRTISLTNKINGEPERFFSLESNKVSTKLVIEQADSESDVKIGDDRVGVSDKAVDKTGNETTNVADNGKVGNGDDNKSANGIEVKDSSNALIELEIVHKSEIEGSSIKINCINNIWPDFKALINMEKSSEEDKKRKTFNSNYILDIGLTCLELGMENAGMVVDIRREDRYDVDFTLPKVDKETTVFITSATQDEIEGVIQEIQFSAARFILANQYLLDAFVSEDQ